MLIEEIMKGVINEPSDAIVNAVNLVALSFIQMNFPDVLIKLGSSFHKKFQQSIKCNWYLNFLIGCIKKTEIIHLT
jgi:hypothetical protein